MVLLRRLPLRRSQGYIKMLMIASCRAAGKYALIAFWAALFCSPVIARDSSLANLESGFNDLVYRLSQSVVTVESFYPLSATVPSGNQNDAVYNVVSTGIIYDSAGHVLTVASSVSSRSKIQIRFEDQTVPAELKAVDHQSGLALLKMIHPVGIPATISWQQGCAGQMLIALGNAYGLRAAPSMGFCSGMRPDGAIQFSAPITSGTLGGGLFDLSGRLVGIISGGIGQGNRTEIGLAIPSSRASEVARYLMYEGTRPAGYLGLSTTEIEVFPPIEINRGNRLIGDVRNDIRIERGVVITNVVPSSPAAKAGLKKGDLLFSVNRQALPSALQLASQVRQSSPGTVMEFGLLRQDRPFFVPVKIGQAEVQTFSSSFSFVVDGTESAGVTDSLLREIEALKQTIMRLEERVRQRR